MNNNELLVKSITLLYLESIIKPSDNSSNLIKTIIDTIKVPEVTVALNHERDITINLKNVIYRMIEDVKEKIDYNKEELLQTLKLNCKEDNLCYLSLENVINKEYSIEEIRKSVNVIKKYFRQFFNTNEIKNSIKKLNTDVLYNNDNKDISQITTAVLEQTEKLQNLCKNNYKEEDKLLDLSDHNAVSDLIEEEINKNGNGEMVLKTGWKGLNRMLGGGFTRGHSIVIGALPHSNKTGFSLSLFRQIAIHNKPFLINKEKKPLLIRITLEDSLSKNLNFLYNLCYENNTGLKTDFKNVSKKESGGYVKDNLQINGYHVKMAWLESGKIAYNTIIDICEKYINEGYEIHLLMIDYLHLIPKHGCEKGAMGDDIKDLFKRIRDYAAPRLITFITPHQLSPDAKRIKRDGFGDFVKRIAGGGYYQGCSSLDNDVDTELFIDIEKLDGKAYQTIQLGKRRSISITPEKDRYVVLPFPEDGRPILDDLNKDYEITLDKPGGSRIDNSNEDNNQGLGF